MLATDQKIPPGDGARPSHQGSMMPVLNSTKNLEIIELPTATKDGVGIFEYTDNYTVFHYGRMPDLIPGKGEAICRMAVFNFTRLEAAGVPTHFRRFIAPNRIEFDLARVPTRTPGRSRQTPETTSSPCRSSSATSSPREALFTVGSRPAP